MDHHVINNRSMEAIKEVGSGTLTSCEYIEKSLISEPRSDRDGTCQQVFEKRYFHGEAEYRSTAARPERDCRVYGNRSAPLYEGSR